VNRVGELTSNDGRVSLAIRVKGTRRDGGIGDDSAGWLSRYQTGRRGMSIVTGSLAKRTSRAALIPLSRPMCARSRQRRGRTT
jgi:hypothetical protein